MTVAREPVYNAEVNWGGIDGAGKKILRGTNGSNPSPSRPPGESRVRTCMLAELDQTEESQIDLGRLLVRVWRHRLGRRRVLVGYRCAWLLQALL
jgi:hypothetical protein